uniref:ATP synthase F1 subunit alpha n=1 Tax=Stachyamoeba lipophora TaxID=463046 RepID=A0A0B5GMW6_STALP|nr:ATP synthase F1 subunit alpha [Stachyamoeba lipophora]AJF22893.1 ATP synthase F1 subunit alpha [Stachyamoeba lipophora]
MRHLLEADKKKKKGNKCNVKWFKDHYLSPGVVLSVADAIAIVGKGLDHAYVGEVVCFKEPDSHLMGLVMNIEHYVTRVALLTGGTEMISTQDKVYCTRKGVRTKVGLGTLGRISDPLGECLNEEQFTYHELTLQDVWNLRFAETEARSPSIIEREPVRTPVHTGINAIDVLLPVGAGQRELIIGDLGSGKTSLALTIILHQGYKNNNLYRQWRKIESNHLSYKSRLFIPCVYVVIGGRRAELSRIKLMMKNSNIRNYTAVIFTGADDLAALQYVAPFAGCCVGEWFRDKGYKAIIVYDELLNHAAAYRQMSLLLRRPPGREAYPGDIFYLHAKLLERAAQLNRKLGGGALTAFPLVETKGGDITAYIPTNIISITDGQVFLNQKIGNSGIQPAIDLNLSVSRVGADAQYNIMKFIGKKVKLAYGVYRTVQGVEKLSGSLDSYILFLIHKGKRIIEFFKQELYRSEDLYKQVICLFAIVENYMDGIQPEYTQFYYTLLFKEEMAITFLSRKNANLISFVSNPNTWNVCFMSLYGKDIQKHLKTFLKAYTEAFIDVYNDKIHSYVKAKM